MSSSTMALWLVVAALVLVKEKSVMVVDYERYSSSSTFPDTLPCSSSFARCCLSEQAMGALTTPGDFPHMAHRGLNVIAQRITT
jgi:hypothetical protein